MKPRERGSSSSDELIRRSEVIREQLVAEVEKLEHFVAMFQEVVASENERRRRERGQ